MAEQQTPNWLGPQTRVKGQRGSYDKRQLRYKFDAYAAGLFDGEGSCQIARYVHEGKKHSYGAVLKVSLTTPSIFKLLQARYGGTIQSRQPVKDNRRPYQIWYLQGPCVERAMRLWLPYLTVKRRQAELVLRFLAIKKQRLSPDERVEKSHQMFEEIHALNTNDWKIPVDISTWGQDNSGVYMQLGRRGHRCRKCAGWTDTYHRLPTR